MRACVRACVRACRQIRIIDFHGSTMEQIPIRLEFRMVLNKVVYCLRYCSVYIYIDNLLMSLKKNDIGCHVGSPFLWGVLVRG